MRLIIANSIFGWGTSHSGPSWPETGRTAAFTSILGCTDKMQSTHLLFALQALVLTGAGLSGGHGGRKTCRRHPAQRCLNVNLACWLAILWKKGRAHKTTSVIPLEVKPDFFRMRKTRWLQNSPVCPGPHSFSPTKMGCHETAFSVGFLFSFVGGFLELVLTSRVESLPCYEQNLPSGTVGVFPPLISTQRQ
ncbi:MAG: hypothetical protein ONB47_13100 [candidate division KSB1 bacterium]|nr:hypothetical protein [candidate division KSB1 bacterium]